VATILIMPSFKNINSARVGPSSSWALVLCTTCTIHCYATGHTASKFQIPTANLRF